MRTHHWHHIVPKHAGGTNKPSNLERLTVAEHAERHKTLFEKYGMWQDELAYKLLSGEIKGAKKLEEFHKRHSIRMSENNVSQRDDVKLKIKAAWTDEKRQARSLLLRTILPGIKKSTTENMKQPKPQLTCPYCLHIGGGHANMYRWHFDNCKQRKI